MTKDIRNTLFEDKAEDDGPDWEGLFFEWLGRATLAAALTGTALASVSIAAQAVPGADWALLGLAVALDFYVAWRIATYFVAWITRNHDPRKNPLRPLWFWTALVATGAAFAAIVITVMWLILALAQPSCAQTETENPAASPNPVGTVRSGADQASSRSCAAAP